MRNDTTLSPAHDLDSSEFPINWLKHNSHSLSLKCCIHVRLPCLCQLRKLLNELTSTMKHLLNHSSYAETYGMSQILSFTSSFPCHLPLLTSLWNRWKEYYNIWLLDEWTTSFNFFPVQNRNEVYKEPSPLGQSVVRDILTLLLLLLHPRLFDRQNTCESVVDALTSW